MRIRKAAADVERGPVMGLGPIRLPAPRIQRNEIHVRLRSRGWIRVDSLQVARNGFGNASLCAQLGGGGEKVSRRGLHLRDSIDEGVGQCRLTRTQAAVGVQVLPRKIRIRQVPIGESERVVRHAEPGDQLDGTLVVRCRRSRVAAHAPDSAQTVVRCCELGNVAQDRRVFADAGGEVAGAPQGLGQAHPRRDMSGIDGERCTE